MGSGRDRARNGQSYIRTIRIMRPRAKSPRGHVRMRNGQKRTPHSIMAEVKASAAASDVSVD